MKDWANTIAARNAGQMPGFYSADVPLEDREPYVDLAAIAELQTRGFVVPATEATNFADVMAELAALRAQLSASQQPAPTKAPRARKATAAAK